MTMVPAQTLSKQQQQQQYSGGGACATTIGGVRFVDQEQGYDHQLYNYSNNISSSTNCIGSLSNNNNSHHLPGGFFSMADEEDSATNSTTNETGSTSNNTASIHRDHPHPHPHPRPHSHPPQHLRPDHSNEDAGEGGSWLRLGIGGGGGGGGSSTTTTPSPHHNNNNNNNNNHPLDHPQREPMLELNLLHVGPTTTTTTNATTLLLHQQAAARAVSLHPPPLSPAVVFHGRPSSSGGGGGAFSPSVPILFYQSPPPHHHQQQLQQADHHQLGWANYLSRSQAMITNPRLLGPAPSSSSSAPYFLQPRPSPFHQLGGAGAAPSIPVPIPDVIRLIDPPRRPHSGIWFMLQASLNQAKEPFLPQLPKSYLRIKDGRMTVRLLIKYLVNKLGLESESEVEIRCRGQELEPNLTIQQVRDEIWSGREAVAAAAFLPQSSTADHVMVLHYSRSS